MNGFSRIGTIAAGVVTLGFALTTLPALAVNVTVNGASVTLAPPPIERAGRVFVPLRGVFEKLGASVVYANGVINATGNNNTIGLRIGSTQATVNGSPRALDVAPFIVGASTYVPLRFVSQALGAGVNYDAANQIVALTTPAGGAAPPPAAPVAGDSNVLAEMQPARGSSEQSARPTISGTFRRAVDANSLRLTLDGLDITNAATRSSTGFVYAPPSPLQSMLHTVQVTGRFPGGREFAQSFTFTSGSAAARNELNVRTPRAGQAVSSTFTVEGRTVPNARVHLVAGGTANLGGVFAFGAGSYVGDTIADASGNFSQVVTLQTVGGASIGLTVTSTDPTTKESAEQRLQLRAR